MISNSYIEQAADDLATIRRAVENVEKANDPLSAKAVNQTRALIHKVALSVSSLFVVTEISTGNLTTKAILYSAQNESVRIDGLSNIAATIFAACVFMYVVIGKASKDAHLDSDSFIQKYFSYLANYKFVTDLIIKFIVVTFVLIAKRPEWLGPLCSIFVADYLLQSRFFVLPKKISFIAGIVCLMTGILSFLFNIPEILVPSLLFSILSGGSLVVLNRETVENKEIA